MNQAPSEGQSRRPKHKAATKEARGEGEEGGSQNVGGSEIRDSPTANVA